MFRLHFVHIKLLKQGVQSNLRYSKSYLDLSIFSVYGHGAWAETEFSFSSLERIFHSYGNYTTACEGLKI